MRSPPAREPTPYPHRGWLLAALPVEAVIALADGAYADLSLAGLVLVGPLLAAHRCAGRTTAVVAAVALVLAIVLPRPDDLAPAVALDRVISVLAVATGGLWAVLTARAHARHRASLARMTRLAELAQRAVVRPLPDRIGHSRLAVHARSATADALIGGDLYDAVLTPAGMRLIIGDVKGHGIHAAHQAAAVLAAFRHAAATETDLARLARTIDARVKPDLGPEDFVTVLLADFLPGEVHLVSCGHPPALRIGRRLQSLEPPRPSLPLGLSPDPHLHRVRLHPAERLLLYTDGLTENRDQDRPLPHGRPLHNALTAPALDQALDRLLDLHHRRVPGIADDDLTLILVQNATDAEAAHRTTPTGGTTTTPPEPDRGLRPA